MCVICMCVVYRGWKLNPDLSNSAGLAGQFAPGIFTFYLQSAGDYIDGHLCGSGVSDWGPLPCVTSTLTPETSP